MAVPGCLGRILTGPDSAPVGTCFQVDAGVLVTAAHVLAGIGAEAIGSAVVFDGLDKDGKSGTATVARVDLVHDLAVLTTTQPLPAVAVRLLPSDAQDAGVVIQLAGTADDPSERELETAGTWRGGTTFDDGTSWGTLRSRAIAPNLAGAPVRRASDDAVIGAVSGRYNSRDDWSREAVWVARTEDLRTLLAGVTDVTVRPEPTLDAVDVRLTVDADSVRLHGADQDVTASHDGVPEDLADFLPEPVAQALATVLRQAGAEHRPVRLGVDAPGFDSRPWESLAGDARVYRHVDAAPARVLPGPLRIVVAIAAPTGGAVDHEAELRDVEVAVRDARVGRAQVTVVPFATTAALRAELETVDAHVLHLAGAAGPSTFTLETDTGEAHPVDAATLLAEAVPPGRLPAVISVVSRDESSFAADLAAQGASVVISSASPRVLARVYADLNRSATPDVVAAVAEARRMVRRDLGEEAVVTVYAGAGSVTALEPGSTEPVARGRREPGPFVGRRHELRTLPADLLAGDRAGIVLCGVGGIGKTTLAARLADVLSQRDPGRLVAVASGELSVDKLLALVAATLREPAQSEPAEVQGAVDYLDRTDEPWTGRWQVLHEVLLPRFPLLLVIDNFEDNLIGSRHRVRDEYLAGLLTLWVTDPASSRLLITSRYEFLLPESAEGHLRTHVVGPMSRSEMLQLAWAYPSVDRLPDLELDRLWRLLGGNPRALEYTDALLSDSKATFRDINDRASAAVRDKYDDEAEDVLARFGETLDPAVGETLALAADEVVLPALVMSVSRRPDARRLLLGMAVYREPVDANAALFHIGVPDESAAWAPDRAALTEQINEIVTEAGLEPQAPMDMQDLPAELQERLAPLVTELYTAPRPPIRPRDNLMRLLELLGTMGLLSVGQDFGGLFVNRWTAAELERVADGDEPLDVRHRNAADYWRWRALDWPQSETGQVHDLLEARYHFLSAGDIATATEITEHVVALLQRRHAWDRATELAQDTVRTLPADAPVRARWLLQLGLFSQLRGDHDLAEGHYLTALDTSQALGDEITAAAALHRLGTLAQERGDYVAAEQHLGRSQEIAERLGDEAGLAAIHYQRGVLAEQRGEFPDAERHHHAALEIYERQGDERPIATSNVRLGALARRRDDVAEAAQRYQVALEIQQRSGDEESEARTHHELGALAQQRDDFGEAELQHRLAMDIEERLGDQVGLAGSHGVLGMLAEQRGDLTEAEQRYQQAMELNERTGNAVELATTYGLFGRLCAAQGRHHEAIELQLRSLSIRSRIQSPDAARNVSVLSALRTEIGEDAFEQEIRSILDEDNAQALTKLLNKVA
ncbi:MAG TPA: tetratricopeptide repeat protein [Pseudonocardiaceae bacterium]|jgi:tetratricopeptide (TPR) repeat protein|nr:tetratricopeptide repeat protein [Pseudonocardiaceae bacterium]